MLKPPQSKAFVAAGWGCYQYITDSGGFAQQYGAAVRFSKKTRRYGAAPRAACGRAIPARRGICRRLRLLGARRGVPAAERGAALRLSCIHGLTIGFMNANIVKVSGCGAVW